MSSSCQSRKLLAINFGGLGDEVLFLPTLKSIKSAFPSWHITLLTEPRSRSILEVTDLVNAGITFDIKKRPLLPADYIALIYLIRQGRYDVVLSSGSSPLVSILLFLSGIRQRVGYDSGLLGRLLLTNPVLLKRNQHAVYMYHDLVRGLGIALEPSPPEIAVDAQSRQSMSDFLQEGSLPEGDTIPSTTGSAAPAQRLLRVLIHPGTSKLALLKGIIKTWHPANWAWLIGKLLDRADVQVILSGGPDDEETIGQIKEHLLSMGIDEFMPASPKKVAESGLRQSCLASRLTLAYGRTRSLRDLAALIDLSDLLVCVDSAPMHIGVGLKKNLVALFGPTDPDKLLFPDSRFIAIAEDRKALPATDVPGKDADSCQGGSLKRPLDSRSAQPQLSPGVSIQRDIVFRTVEDQLHSIAARGSFQESRRP